VLTANLGAFFYGAIVVALFTLGFLVAYNASALINWILLWVIKADSVRDGSPWTPAPVASPSQDPFVNVQKIGIVLAGGGAKGAFQAGSMKAIYQFLATITLFERLSHFLHLDRLLERAFLVGGPDS